MYLNITGVVDWVLANIPGLVSFLILLLDWIRLRGYAGVVLKIDPGTTHHSLLGGKTTVASSGEVDSTHLQLSGKRYRILPVSASVLARLLSGVRTQIAVIKAEKD